MGLDQYAYAKNEFGEVIEIAYWRKHHDLHGFMDRVYQENGGTEVFNCIKLSITEEILDSLERAVNEGDLPHTEGFFFGSGNTNGYKEEDLKFIKMAREMIKDGDEIYYDSWW